MRTIVETDMTMVKVAQQSSSRNKKKIILALIISIVLICSMLILLIYVNKRDEHPSNKLQQNNYTLLIKRNQSTNNDNEKYQDSQHHQILQIQIGERNNTNIIADTNNLSGSQPNQFNKPKKVHFDSQGNMLVLDSNNQRIQKFPIEKNKSNRSHLNLYPLQRSTPLTHHRVLPHRPIISLSQGENPTGEVPPPKKMDSPIGDNFFPQPSFGVLPQPVDSDTRQPSDGISFDEHRSSNDLPIFVHQPSDGISFNEHRSSIDFPIFARQPSHDFSSFGHRPSSDFSSFGHRPSYDFSSFGHQPSSDFSVNVPKIPSFRGSFRGKG